MLEAEKTRDDLSMRIHALEHDKKDLEEQNARTIEENRGLLNQLEDLNTTIATSETHVKSLEATLQSTQQELRRLDHLAARTQDLEIQLAALETEQLSLQQTVSRSEADERLAIQRWKRAERNLTEVQDQLERMEREAREEKERHNEVIARMERQRRVEGELGNAAGRLKSAAASSHTRTGSSNVVSHFVKDILQDNANLQLGIVELREMLENSNNEVEMLRQQVMLHQPVGAEEETGSSPSTLRAELAPVEPQLLSQELHIHHHYHAAPKDKTPRPKKKRPAISAGVFTPPNGRMRPSSASTAAAILSQTSITVPSPNTPYHRWSMASNQTMSDFASSVPSSPTSTNHRASSLFDRSYIDAAMDSSRPTSPGSSIDPTSPTIGPYHKKRDSNYSFKQASAFNLDNTIKEEGEDGDVEDLPQLPGPANKPSSTDPDGDQAVMDSASDKHDYFDPMAFQPSLRRATSHESILSVSGIDIHTLKTRPSQMTIRNQPHLLQPRARPSMSTLSTSYVSTQPIISNTSAVARPILSRHGHDSSSYLRSSMGLPDPPRITNPGRAASINSSSSNDSGPGTHKKASRGGWMWGRWGATPAPAASSSSHSSVQNNSMLRTVHGPPLRAVSTPVVPTKQQQQSVDPLRAFMGRPPGINQKGPVPGRWQEVKAPSVHIVPRSVDRDALKEVLEE